MRLAIGLVPDTSRNTTLAIGGTSIGPVSVPVHIRIMAIAKLDGKGLRSWDIAHPRLWGTAINEGNVPWAGSERITAAEDIEETHHVGPAHS